MMADLFLWVCRLGWSWSLHTCVMLVLLLWQECRLIQGGIRLGGCAGFSLRLWKKVDSILAEMTPVETLVILILILWVSMINV